MLHTLSEDEEEKKAMHNLPGQFIDHCILPLIWSSPPSTDLSKETYGKALSHSKEDKVVLGKIHETLCLLVFQNRNHNNILLHAKSVHQVTHREIFCLNILLEFSRIR